MARRKEEPSSNGAAAWFLDRFLRDLSANSPSRAKSNKRMSLGGLKGFSESLLTSNLSPQLTDAYYSFIRFARSAFVDGIIRFAPSRALLAPHSVDGFPRCLPVA
jgi:hypothetical protein